jgi:vacuolar-type H+-ATPase subunit I/STV1
MTVLTQDQSRQFLSKASPRDKYNVRFLLFSRSPHFLYSEIDHVSSLFRIQFFLRGTQLAQLTEEYEQIRANTETMEEALTRKREVIPELKDAYKRAKDRYKEAQAALEQKNNLDKLKNQLAWSYVEEMEEVSSFCSRFPSCSKAKVLTFRSR